MDRQTCKEQNLEVKDKSKSIHLLIVDKEGKKMLYHQRRQDDYYALPGGKVEEGEDLLTALLREVKEEYNLDLKHYKRFIEVLGKVETELGEHYLALLKVDSDTIYNWVLFDVEIQEEEVKAIIYDLIDGFKELYSEEIHPILLKQLRTFRKVLEEKIGRRIR